MTNDINSNIIPAINYIISTIPEDLNDLEKVRYIYIELGKIFSYDYRIIVDEESALSQIDYSKDSISRFKTCYQISEVLAILINGILPNCEAKVVERKINGRQFNNEHVATDVKFKDGLNILLDLTLDLANIQANMRTKEFGFSTDAEGTYDIISQKECEVIDKKIGFIANKYTDDIIDEFKEKMDNTDLNNLSKQEQVDYKIKCAKEELFKTFKGNHEAVRYINTLLNKILNNDEKSSLKQYNLSYQQEDSLDYISIFTLEEFNLYYSYSNELGFNKITPKAIETLLKNGWKTNSKTISNIFNNEDNKIKK